MSALPSSKWTAVPIDIIEAERQRSGVTIAAAAAAFEIDQRTYYRYLSGALRVKPSRAQFMVRALRALVETRVRDGDPDERGAARTYRLVLAIVASREGVAVDEVARHDPARRATNDPAWMRAARIRRAAVYLCNTVYGMPQAVLARVTGLSPAAVSLACGDVERARDELAVERTLEELAAMMMEG